MMGVFNELPKLTKEAEDRRKTVKGNIDDDLMLIDTNLDSLAKMEDNLSKSTCLYTVLENSHQKLREIEKSVAGKVMRYTYPTYRKVPGTCGQISMMEIDPSSLQTRGMS